MNTRTTYSILGDFLALIAGAILPFAFAPFSWFFLAIIAPAMLFVIWQNVTPARCFWRGWLFGVGFFGVGVSWVYVSFSDFSDMPMISAILLTVAFVAFLALYPAILGWFVARFFPDIHYGKYLLLLPSLWVLFEWIRSWLLTGFPWLSLGYSQIETPLRGFAPIFGIYGVSIAVAFTAGLLAYMVRANQWKMEETLLAILLFTGVWGGGWILTQQIWYKSSDSPFSVALIQGNIPQEFKWNQAYQLETIERYLKLTQQHRSADVVIWPETAITTFYHFQFTQKILDILMQERALYQTDFLLGMPYVDEQGLYYNSVLSLSDAPNFYHKNHLVPFGEYIPLMNWFDKWLDFLKLPMSSFSAGDFYQENLTAAGQMIGVSICYEAAFGERIRTALPEASVLVNVSNDAWFGNSIAPHQHLEIAQMRALEMGRYLLRATNTGISAIIAPSGQVIARSPQFEVYALTGEVQPLQGVTPYVRLGELPLLLLTMAMLLLGMAIYGQTRRDLI
ncbi:apolipoprotein N-acyltransferase [Thioflexithrix psekupsensis]|uniref:Apolipoprotein N-acyltransferase n=1 Tax=Thioflexithrix psekupsensis TaxID=1570016 RepID=A0A251X719_9GAMM|nr:apolipoprotein N-acyltransferase [Thioflexithrix psekupsensis]OUD13868.1 apolipoprotein N-acyltransferase [Thioflexithrix psekupsensis]